MELPFAGHQFSTLKIPALPADIVEEETASTVAPELQAKASKQDDQAPAYSELTFMVHQLPLTKTTEGRASQTLPGESAGEKKRRY